MKFSNHAAVVCGICIITGIAMDNTFGGIIALGGLCYGFWGTNIRKNKEDG